MRSVIRPALLLAGLGAALPACTGLMAGPTIQNSVVVPVSRDSSWVRAKRAMTAEVFSFDLQDSVGGTLAGVRHPKVGTLAADPLACRLHVTYILRGTPEQTTVGARALYTVPKGKDGQPAAECEDELSDALARMSATIETGR